MPRDERRTSGRPTRRRESASRPETVRGATADRYRGPLRRRDDPTLRRDRSDESLREAIREQLLRHPGVHPSDIDAQVEAGEVTLQGTVADRDTRWLVEDLVESVAGVSLVHNQLRVAPR
jgi:osmotically-inducible protein OsmY